MIGRARVDGNVVMHHHVTGAQYRDIFRAKVVQPIGFARDTKKPVTCPLAADEKCATGLIDFAKNHAPYAEPLTQ